MRNIVLTVAYDGTRYFGWQKTIHGPSIEDTLERVIITLVQHPVVLQAASRTDKGVHASNQIVNFYTSKMSSPHALQRGLNALLPDDIRVITVHEARDTFHPTQDAHAKEYHYLIDTSPVLLPHRRYTHWHVSYPVDVISMQQAATYCIGKKDFSALRNQRKGLVEDDCIREIFRIDIERRDSIICIRMTGDKFLYKMARNITGTLLYVGIGKFSPEYMKEVLQSRKRAQAGICAPPQGLTLKRVIYG